MEKVKGDTTMKKRKILGFLGVAAMSILLAACTESANDNTATKESTETAASNRF